VPKSMARSLEKAPSNESTKKFMPLLPHVQISFWINAASERKQTLS
jgi:hypothetical protein